MNVAPEVAAGYLRVSFGPDTSEADIDAFLAEFAQARRAPVARGMIYLDYQATTPLAPEVATAMAPWIEEQFANPHSPSRGAARPTRRSSMRGARSSARSVWSRAASPSPGARPRRSTGRSRGRWNRRPGAQPDRHHRDRTCRGARQLRVARRAGRSRSSSCPVGADGLVDLDVAREARSTSAPRSSRSMLVNNEIGVIQPVAEIAEMAHAAGALMLCDAVQALRAGRDPRRARPGRDVGAQDPRAQGHRRLVDAQGRRTRAADPWRRAGAGPALGHVVAGFVRRLRRSGEAGGRAR